jgi:RecA-family ATPase
VEWLWQDRLASGALSMLSGDRGVGKTWVALAIAAALSRGRAPFSGDLQHFPFWRRTAASSGSR